VDDVLPTLHVFVILLILLFLHFNHNILQLCSFSLLRAGILPVLDTTCTRTGSQKVGHLDNICSQGSDSLTQELCIRQTCSAPRCGFPVRLSRRLDSMVRVGVGSAIRGLWSNRAYISFSPRPWWNDNTDNNNMCSCGCCFAVVLGLEDQMFEAKIEDLKVFTDKLPPRAAF